jgi:hypothetical protein
MKGLLEYGALATKYVQSFDQKWVRGKSPDRQELLGTSDIQSLADLRNSYDIVRQMRIVVIDRKTALTLLVSAALPFLPLLLTIMPLEQVVQKAMKLIF